MSILIRKDTYRGWTIYSGETDMGVWAYGAIPVGSYQVRTTTSGSISCHESHRAQALARLIEDVKAEIDRTPEPSTLPFDLSKKDQDKSLWGD